MVALAFAPSESGSASEVTGAAVVAADLHMETDYSPYQGMEIIGWPATVLLRGRVVLDDGELKDPGPVGIQLEAGELGLGASTTR
jgi:hypothetical protein